MKNKTIRVCDRCETPLIWTFVFDYNERYCLNCGAMGGMLGTGTDLPATRELIFKKKLVDALWKVIYDRKGLMPNGKFGRTNCKKETNCYDHRKHLTLSEREWDTIANKYLISLQGIFIPHS